MWSRGGVWEKEGNKRASGRQWERNARESATFFLLKLIKYGPGLLKTRGLPEDWLCPGPGRLCSLLNCTLHCSHKAPRTVLTHIHTSEWRLLHGFHLVSMRWTDRQWRVGERGSLQHPPPKKNIFFPLDLTWSGPASRYCLKISVPLNIVFCKCTVGLHRRWLLLHLVLLSLIMWVISHEKTSWNVFERSSSPFAQNKTEPHLEAHRKSHVTHMHHQRVAIIHQLVKVWNHQSNKQKDEAFEVVPQG